jgi:hypothetical protein
MRSLDEVTEEEIKAEYDNTPAINQYVPWAEVLESHTFKTLLKNQVISHEEKQMEKPTNVIALPVPQPMAPRFVRAQLPAEKPGEVKKISRRSTITLHERQIEKLKSALVLSRNCLKYGGMSDAVRNEALDSIAESQKIIQSFYEPRG